MNMPQAIDHLNLCVDRIRREWPEFTVGPHRICGEENLLNDLVSYMSSNSDVEVRKDRFYEFAGDGGSVLAVVLKCKAGVRRIGVALASFCGLRKCRIAIKLKGQEISVEGPSAEDLEKLLRVADELFIHPTETKTS